MDSEEESDPVPHGLASRAAQPAINNLAAQVSGPVSAALTAQGAQMKLAPLSAALAQLAPVSAALTAQVAQMDLTPVSAALTAQVAQMKLAPLSAALAQLAPVSAQLMERLAAQASFPVAELAAQISGVGKFAFARQLMEAGNQLQPSLERLQSRVAAIPKSSAPAASVVLGDDVSISRNQEPSTAPPAMSDKERARWLSVLLFMFVYFSLSVAIRYDVMIAQISTETGANPFEIAVLLTTLAYNAKK
jgi:hypothetical protein